MTKIATTIREYSEGYAVELGQHNGRAVVVAYNEGTLNCTQVDIEDLLDWLAEHQPELLALKVPGN